MGGRIDVEADDVFELLSELRVRRQLERAHAMRRELVGLEDTLHRSQATRRFRQHSTGPVGFFSRWRSERQVDNLLHGVGRQRWFAGRARRARQPFNALRHEPRLPSPYHRLRFARSAHNLGRAAAVGRGKDDVGAPHVFAARCDPHNRLKQTAVGSCDVHNNSALCGLNSSRLVVRRGSRELSFRGLFLRIGGGYGKRNKLKSSKLSSSRSNRSHLMRKLIFTCIAATLVAAPMTTIVKAEDTTIIKRDRDGEGDKTVIKKREELKVLPVPHTEEKTIIKKERD